MSDQFIHQPGRGDQLAAGGSKATFALGGPKEEGELKVTDKRPVYDEKEIAERQRLALEKRAQEVIERKHAIEAAFAAAVEVGKKAHPVGDKVLVWPMPDAEESLLAADVSQRKPVICTVLAVSDRPSDQYSAAALGTLSVGDVVLILSQTGTEVEIEGTNAVVLHVYDILLRL